MVHLMLPRHAVVVKFGSHSYKMACLCQICGEQRPAHHKFWMPSQIRSIWQTGTSTTNTFNRCRVCNPECWVDLPLPHGAHTANTCLICGEQRPGHRQYWMPSQVRSIWHLGSSVTSEFNCCRLCNPNCWTPIAGPVHSVPPWDPNPAEPVPPPPPESPPSPRKNVPVTVHSAPSSPTTCPPPCPPPPPVRFRRFDDKSIRVCIRDIQELVPAALWELIVTRVKLPLRDKLCTWGACLVPHSAEGLEALRLFRGGCNLVGNWVDYHTAVVCVQRDDIPIFLDPGNAVYTDFLQQLWPQSTIWDNFSNQEKIGDIIEALFGAVILRWSVAWVTGTHNQRVVDHRAVFIFKTMSRTILAGF